MLPTYVIVARIYKKIVVSVNSNKNQNNYNLPGQIKFKFNDLCRFLNNRFNSIKRFDKVQSVICAFLHFSTVII